MAHFKGELDVNWCLKISTINQLVTEFTEIWKRGFYTQKKREKPKGVWSRKGLMSNDKIEKRTYYSRERHRGHDPFNQDFRKFRSKTQWIGSVQPEKFQKNGSTFWGGPLFPVGPVGILVEWIAPKKTYDISSVKRVTRKFLEVSRCSRAKQRQRNVQKKCFGRAKLLFC